MKKLSIACGLAALALATPALAGLYTDDLSRCIVNGTNDKDRTVLVRWMFMAIAQNPSVAQYASIKPEEVEAASKDAAGLFTRLLVDTCAKQARDAIRNEGVGAIKSSFEVLGGVAGTGLVADPAVARMISSLDKYVDKSKLDALAKPDAGDAAK